MARDAFLIEVQYYRMACQPSLSRQPPCIVLGRLSKKTIVLRKLFPFIIIQGLHFEHQCK